MEDIWKTALRRRWLHLLAALAGLLCAAVALAPRVASAAEIEACEPGPPLDEGVFVLTMEPGGQLFSAFGHNGLYVRDYDTGIDTVFNFGVFDARNPNLLTGFLAGEIDYLLGTRSYESMEALYAKEDRTVYRQELAFSPALRSGLSEALIEEAKPENSAYRYHWLHANCSTRLFDALDEALDGSLTAQLTGPDEAVSRRSEVLRHVARDPHVWFGLRFTMARAADVPLSARETLFLPHRLAAALERSELDGVPLVVDTCQVRAGAWPAAPDEQPGFDLYLVIAGLALGALVYLLGGRMGGRGPRVVAGVTVALLALVASVLGAASTWLWTVSSLEIFWYNLALFNANPAHLIAVLAGLALAFEWRGLAARLEPAVAALAALGGLGLLVDIFVSSQDQIAIGLLFAPTWVALLAALRLRG